MYTKYTLHICLIISILFFLPSKSHAQSCEIPVIEICTQPITPVVLCPDFCFPDDNYDIVDAHSIFECSLVPLGGCLQYTALPGFIAVENVSIVACDYFGVCDTAYVVINVTANAIDCEEPLPCPPNVDSACTFPNTALDICPQFCLTEAYSILQIQSSETGSVFLTDDCITYMPAFDYLGNEQLSIVACETSGALCDTAYINILVNNCDEPPPPSPNELCTPVFTPIDICVGELGDDQYLDIEQSHSQFQCNLTNTTDYCITYHPFPGMEGTDVITLVICDLMAAGGIDCVEHEYIINIGCATPQVSNDYAYITPQFITINGSSTFTELNEGYNGIEIPVLANDSFDVCNGNLSIELIGSPLGGTLEVTDSDNLFFVPDNGFVGGTTVLYNVCNECGNCNIANLSIEVNAPVEVPDCESHNENIAASVGEILTFCPDFCLDPPFEISSVNNSISQNYINIVDNTCINYTALSSSLLDEVYIIACDNTSTCDTAYISLSIVNTGIENQSSIPHISIQNNILHINHMPTMPQYKRLNIVNVQGQMVYTISQFSGQTQQISLPTLPKGVYFVLLQSTQQTQTIKVLHQ